MTSTDLTHGKSPIDAQTNVKRTASRSTAPAAIFSGIDRRVIGGSTLASAGQSKQPSERWRQCTATSLMTCCRSSPSASCRPPNQRFSKRMICRPCTVRLAKANLPFMQVLSFRRVLFRHPCLCSSQLIRGLPVRSAKPKCVTATRPDPADRRPAPFPAVSCFPTDRRHSGPLPLPVAGNVGFRRRQFERT